MNASDVEAAPGDDAASPARAVIGIGASAGGVEALTALVRELPPGLPAAVFVVLHVSSSGTSVLSQILNRAGPLTAVPGRDGDIAREGRIYVAPPDRHLLLDEGVVRLSAGPRENGHRPAVDPTFRSLASYGPAATGVILSGTRDDGTQGLAQIKAAGGGALAQAPSEAAYDGMIQSAIASVDVDAVLPVAEIATHLVQRAQPPMPIDTPSDVPQDPPEDETDTRYTCPECGGHITREENGGAIRYRCEVGHAYSPSSFDGDQALAVEAALWTATRLLGDRATLLEEMAHRADRHGHDRTARGFRVQADEARQAGFAVRALLEEGRVPTAGGGRAAAS